MVIDMRTRLPHGHLANKAADMQFHARQLASCAAELKRLMAELEQLSVRGLVRELNGAD